VQITLEVRRNMYVYHVITKALWKAVPADTCTHGSRPPLE
jgi:hypothetical protein